MEPKYNFWLERNNQVVLSIWRIKLLDAIAQTGSISAGAEKMGVPYRVAWQKVREMEERLGQKLLETQTGGRDGGGAKLTPLAAVYVEKFIQYNEEAHLYLQARCEALFGEIGLNG
ncbi:MAG TPA: LysR family transcriptional regulator [Anaerolineales bacterium]|nr:LysR family transcriptional regulator [Anaerolineales bacterium]